MASDRLSAAARGVVEGLLRGKRLDDLVPASDPVRQEVEDYLTDALSDGDSGRSRTSGSGKRRPSRKSSSKRRPASRQTAVAYSDGAARGNPGAAAVGIRVLSADGVELVAEGWTIGRATNNVAEYRGALAALEKARNLGITELELRLDSELVVKQLNGEYRVKNAELAALKAEVDRLTSEFHDLRFVHVPRERNAEADRLANEALDAD